MSPAARAAMLANPRLIELARTEPHYRDWLAAGAPTIPGPPPGATSPLAPGPLAPVRVGNCCGGEVVDWNALRGVVE